MPLSVGFLEFPQKALVSAVRENIRAAEKSSKYGKTFIFSVFCVIIIRVH
jgi:hypothetical protein